MPPCQWGLTFVTRPKIRLFIAVSMILSMSDKLLRQTNNNYSAFADAKMSKFIPEEIIEIPTKMPIAIIKA